MSLIIEMTVMVIMVGGSLSDKGGNAVGGLEMGIMLITIIFTILACWVLTR